MNILYIFSVNVFFLSANSPERFFFIRINVNVALFVRIWNMGSMSECTHIECEFCLSTMSFNYKLLIINWQYSVDLYCRILNIKYDHSVYIFRDSQCQPLLIKIKTSEKILLSVFIFQLTTRGTIQIREFICQPFRKDIK